MPARIRRPGAAGPQLSLAAAAPRRAQTDSSSRTARIKHILVPATSRPASAQAAQAAIKRFAIRRLHPDRRTRGRAMDHSHYSKVFGLSLAAALGLMLALSALAQSAHPKSEGAQDVPGRH